MKIVEPNITKEDIQAVVRCLEEGQLSGRSQMVKDFEHAFAEKFHVKHAIAVNSGTSALFLALKALGIGKGDEVIVPAFGYIAIANAVTYTGASVVFVDVEPETFNIDPEKVKRAITTTTKAIIAVHTYGLPCDMEALMSFGVPVIEDAAEAHGATYKGEKCGSIGTLGCFSFFANKTITTGEGGMVTTNDDTLAEEVAKLRDQYNGEQKYKHDKVGYSLCMGAMQAALGLSQLQRLDELVARQRMIASNYFMGLKGRKQQMTIGHSYWMFAVELNQQQLKALEEAGIETRPSFYPLHWQEPYRRWDIHDVTEMIYKTFYCLPMSVTPEQQEKVLNKLNDFSVDN